jgi:hypothetical protein
MGSSCIFDLGGTGTVQAGEMTLADDGTWLLVIVEDQFMAPGARLVHRGTYATSGNQITFNRQGCETIPFYGATEGAALSMLYSSTCHTGYEFVLNFVE